MSSESSSEAKSLIYALYRLFECPMLNSSIKLSSLSLLTVYSEFEFNGLVPAL